MILQEYVAHARTTNLKRDFSVCCPIKITHALKNQAFCDWKKHACVSRIGQRTGNSGSWKAEREGHLPMSLLEILVQSDRRHVRWPLKIFLILCPQWYKLYRFKLVPPWQDQAAKLEIGIAMLKMFRWHHVAVAGCLKLRRKRTIIVIMKTSVGE